MYATLMYVVVFAILLCLTPLQELSVCMFVRLSRAHSYIIHLYSYKT